MLKFIKSFFGKKQDAQPEAVPYKVESPVIIPVAAADVPVFTEVAKKPAKTAKPKAEKKPAVKAKSARKTKTPKV